jgi:hypothetical protein
MIHTEIGRLNELLEMMFQDRLHVSEALGVGPSGIKSADKTLLADLQRSNKFSRRLDNQTAIIEILRGMLHD